ncbi:MAG: desulfoferrodoxin [Candidatus Micrarchaeota archaeon]
MTELNEIYKCNICGNIVEMVHTGVGTLVCCGQPMELQKEKTKDVGSEKHVPIVEKTNQGVRVRVGSIPHPMEEKHFIEWIEILANGRVYRKKLEPSDAPETEFAVKADKISARAYCNIHGLWKA